MYISFFVNHKLYILKINTLAEREGALIGEDMKCKNCGHDCHCIKVNCPKCINDVCGKCEHEKTVKK